MKVNTYIQGGGISFLLILGLVWFIVPSYLFIIKNCSIECDSLLSPVTRDTVRAWVKDYCINKPFQTFNVSSVHQQFPYIGQVIARYSAQGNFYCSCKAMSPYLIINGKYLLMADSSVHLSEYYDSNVCAALPSVTCVHDYGYALPRELCRCFVRIQPDLFERFSLYWVDQTSVYLHDKKVPALFMRADSVSLFDERLLIKYEAVKKEIIGQRNYAKKQWTLDMRFKNQVVVAQKGMEGL